MCGIAGVMTKDGRPPSPEILEAMTSALAHRGPDGEGRYSAGGTGLSQTRLAIIDLKTGDQPLHGENGTVLVANGEIYNYLELAREFGASRLKTHSDCELPLLAYARDGEAFAGDLRGMYAISLFDARERKLFRSITRSIPAEFCSLPKRKRS
jgi:asparagine synthase (glutamine-hydrolysing)